MDEEIKAGKFKAECLKVMERVRKTGKNITITKRNVPIAKLVPVAEEESQVFGKLKGSIRFKGNIIESICEEWNASS